VLIETRRAADLIGATKMDRPEWIAAYPIPAGPSCTSRSPTTTSAAPPAARHRRPQPAREQRLRPHPPLGRDRADHASVVFKWDIFVLAGDPASADPVKQGNIQGDAFGSPDGLWFDPDGRLWIQTDVSPARWAWATMPTWETTRCWWPIPPTSRSAAS
jgi:secreted PhoX family phosphatase